MDPLNDVETLRVLFDELVELDESERQARLHSIGAQDEELRRRLEAMLLADTEAETNLHAYAAAAARSILADAGTPGPEDPLGLVGRTVGRYRIDGVLGAGGMGVVYRATDLRLGRVAALKLLPPAWSLDPHAKGRFLQEARAASSLDHANICTIYEADETSESTLYIAMACYEGETLRDRLDRGPLAIEEALDLAAQAADGLAAAHAEGLVHRDIKPANLLVTTDGTLKILDFGIAKVADAGLTLTGQRPGTEAYMAPEQARGDVVDGRADLWSLGVVVYQMLTGRRPTIPGMGDRVPAPSALRPGIPAPVDTLVLRLLEDEPAARPARAAEVADLLEHCLAGRSGGRLTGRRGMPRMTTTQPQQRTPVGRRRAAAYAGAGAILVALLAGGAYLYRHDIPSAALLSQTAGEERYVAVLPFANTSPDTNNEYFVDGVTDDVLMRLAQVPEFSVISRTTTMGYKGSDKSVREIAQELGVGYVLEGSVRRDDDRVRISAQLVDGRADQRLWGEIYDRQIEDIFAVQTEIAQAIVGALEAELSGDLPSRIAQRPTADLEAYDLFLHGRASFYQYDIAGHERAIELFREALERDPAFTLARAWLSGVLAAYSFNVGTGGALADSAVAIARQAVAEEPRLADGYTSLGTALLGTGRYDEGQAALEQALELNSNDWAAISNLGVAYAHRGRLGDAIRLSRRSLELEARASLPAYVNLAWYSMQLGMYDRAEAALELADQLEPDHPYLTNNRGWLELLRGDHDAARLTAERLAADASEVPRRGLSAAQLFVRLGDIERTLDAAEVAYESSPTAAGRYLVGLLYGYALDQTGQSERARTVLTETERYARERIESGDEENLLRHSLAGIHALRGELDEAFHWLDEAIRLGWVYAAVTASDPILEPLHGDPRFQAALDRIELTLAPVREDVAREGL